MLVRSHVHQQWELMKWILLMAAAMTLALAVASGIAGAAEFRPPMDEPALFSNEIAQAASPMSTQEQTPVAQDDVSLQVWQALDAQYQRDFETAIVLWNELEMPCGTEAWKRVALGQAYLATGEIDEASTALELAEKLDPDNAVVHYFVGVLRLQQAWLADEWNSAEGSGTMNLVAHAPQRIVPNTRSMYEYTAMMELESAIKLGPTLHLYGSLVPEDWPTDAAMAPTVHDLLLATRSDNFVAKAHNMLGDLYLQRGSLEQAEQHMDDAVAGGLHVCYGYSELAEAYESVGQHSDAMRAYMKAAQDEPGKVAPLKKAWENLWESML